MSKPGTMSGDTQLQEARMSQCERDKGMLNETGGQGGKRARPNVNFRRGIRLRLKAGIIPSAFD